MSLDAEANDLKALLSTATSVQVLDLDEVKALGTPPARYVELHLAPRFGGQPRLDGSRKTTLRRVTTRVAADTISNARLLEQRIAAVFSPATCVVDGRTVLVSYESGGGRFTQDSTWWTAATDWTF